MPTAAIAHTGEPLAPHDLWSAWEFDPGVVIPLALSAVLYARGARRSRGATPRQRVAFWSGWALLAAALVSPLHPLGEALFSAHMVQHEILMIVAAPLLVISRPLAPMLWGLPAVSRRAAGRLARVPNIDPFTAWLVHAAALWIWHAPPLFQATLTSDLAHTAQHLSFLVSALVFWWSLFHRRGTDFGASLVSIFTTAVHTSILGALLALAPSLWYPAYDGRTAPWGLTALQDQQIGGLVMWVPAGVVYLGVGLYLLGQWIRESDVVALRRWYAQ